MKLSLLHITEYHYPEPAYSSFNELWMCPVTDDRQTLLDFALAVTPETPVQSRPDYFGNRVHFVHVAEHHWMLSIAMRAQVLTFPSIPPQRVAVSVLDISRPQFFGYLSPTKRVPLNDNWLARLGIRPPSPDDDLVFYIQDLTRFLQVILTYQPNTTDVNTPLEHFVQTKTGVCQDYAHAMLAVLRTAGIPARYVSGYLHTGVGGGGSHAWVEVYFPGCGWVGFDPTNGTMVTQVYVKVAHGRDYDDCPPLKGLRWGGGRETLLVTVRVTDAASGG